MFEDEPNSNKNIENLEVYQKASEITELVVKIADIVNEEINDLTNEAEKNLAVQTLNDMMGNAYQLPVKISGAEGAGLYDIKMENATIIRRSSRELFVACTGLEMLGIEKSLDYLQLLRQEIDLFRIAFAEWVKTFDKWDYIIDRWGLFNPPGVNYNDHAPDDDLPFHSNDIEL